MAVADAMLQRNAPLPPGLACEDSSQGNQRFDPRTWHGNSAVALKPFGPFFKSCFELLLDQKPAEARAIDEEVAEYARTVCEQDG